MFSINEPNIDCREEPFVLSSSTMRRRVLAGFQSAVKLLPLNYTSPLSRSLTKLYY